MSEAINPLLQKVIEHLRQIGLQVDITPGATGFAPGVLIVEGVLHVDPQCAPSSLIHDAAHLACVPARFRKLMSGNLAIGMKKMMAELDSMKLPPDHPLERAAMQCSDSEATAWSWATGLHLGMRPEEIIMDTEYGNSGAVIRSMLLANEYFGINGLAAAGMCKRGYRVDPSERYPIMLKWLQDA